MGKELTLTSSKLVEVFNWAYDKSMKGIPGLESAQEMAADYLKGSGSLEDKINRLIRWQNTKAGTAGFISGLGGLITLPVTLPANIAGVIYIQLRMIAAIACMCGHDITDDRVKTIAIACLAGNEVKDVMKETGIAIGKKLTTTAIRNISRETITKINQKVGFRLITKFGEKGLINLGKAVPILGGIIGGGSDVLATNIIGNVARNTFMDKD